MSYAHDDDYDGTVTVFCQRLGNEIRMQLGDEFLIFQDKEHLLLGQNWEERIADTLLRDITFLIPVLTPRFFKRDRCRAEVERFLTRERELGRNDLILPVYYVDAAVLNERDSDPIAREMSKRQWIDWRELRLEPSTSPQVARNFERMAKQVVDAVGRTKTASPIAPTKTRTHSVDPFPNRGDFWTIGQAIAAAQPGARIMVRPGLYKENLEIEKPLEIIGEGSPGSVVVEATGRDVIWFRSTMGRIANLTLRQTGGGVWFGVDIEEGRLELDGCDITSAGSACIGIHNGADPVLRRNQIHHGKQSGVCVYEQGRGILEENDIFDNAGAGVEISKQGNLILRRNKINRNAHEAVWIYHCGGATIDGNDLRHNKLGAFNISEDSKANVKLSNNQE